VSNDTNWNGSYTVLTRPSTTQITFTVVSTLTTPASGTMRVGKTAIPFIVDGGVVYMSTAMIKDATITNAKIANLAVDDAKIANLNVSKLVAGSISVGQYIQSTGYVAGSAGWRINGDGTAEFSGVVVRGTVYASGGLIGGITIASNSVRAGQTAFNTGNGFHLGSDGRFSLGNATGNRLTWDGTNLNVVGGGTFSGALSAATGTFTGNVSAGQFTTGAITSYAFPVAGATFGTYLGPSGLLIGNANNGATSKYFQVEASGNIYAPGFSVVNGTLTINQANVINTLQLAGNSATVSNAATGSGTTVSTTLLLKANQTIKVVLIGYFDSFAHVGTGSGDFVAFYSLSIDGNAISARADRDTWDETANYFNAKTYMHSISLTGGAADRSITVSASVTVQGVARSMEKVLSVFGMMR
jgi:hypothetical protein